MSQPLDLSQFPNLPPEVVKAFAAQKAALEAATPQIADLRSPLGKCHEFTLTSLIELLHVETIYKTLDDYGFGN